MQLLEYEAKRLVAAEGLDVPRGMVASTPREAARAAAALGGKVVLKAQVPRGGRGKAGGIRIVDAGKAAVTASALLGTAIGGARASQLLVEEHVAADAELFIGIAVDPRLRRPLLLLSGHGGIDVEREADRHIGSADFSPRAGIQPSDVLQAGARAQLDPATARILMPLAQLLWGVFVKHGLQTIEINPLFKVRHRLVAGDVRAIPDPALDTRPPRGRLERRSAELGFDLLELEPQGDVALITTGAGASMMLIDVLTECGCAPINFCDIRTGSFRGDPARLMLVLSELSRYPNLRVLAVNVFAGVTDLGQFVELLLRALADRPPPVPVIVRVAGRGAAQAQTQLRAAGLQTAHSLEHLVALVADLAKSEAPSGAPA